MTVRFFISQENARNLYGGKLAGFAGIRPC